MTKKTASDVVALLRARNPLLWIVSREEARVERYIVEAAAACGYQCRAWDVARGFTNNLPGGANRIDANFASPDAALTFIDPNRNKQQRTVWIMRDLPQWLQGPIGATTLRQLRNLARDLPSVARDYAQAIVILTPSSDVPPELANHATVIDWPMPDRSEIEAVLDAAIDALPDDLKATAAPNGARDQAIDAAIGLSGEEAAACYAKSLVQLRRIDPVLVGAEKKRVVAREKVLEWFDPLPGGLDAVGGLENLKIWLQVRRSAYSPQARAYGLPAPKGCVLVGVQGCGKSLTAKAIATAWGIPLLRLDMGALKSKYVGESEGNLRRALRVIDAIGRCVVWIDEIEKAMQGATSGSADGGVSADALGAILSWMQERQGEAFVVATSNDVEGLPPELLRKGRFDEIWFIDAPTLIERKQIMAASLRQYKRDPSTIDLDEIARATAGFTGSEIAQLVPEAMFAAFNDGERAVDTEDVLIAAATVVPLTVMAKEKITKLREWAKQRARYASTPEPEAVPTTEGRAVDFAA